jgi:lycopene cyclase domain-containing protein
VIALPWTSFLYLGLLLGVLASTVAVDRRARLVLFSATPGRGAAVLVAGTLVFLAWDLVAIDRGFYARGGPVTTGVELAPHLPLEELFFILFLCHLTLVLHGLLRRGLARRAASRSGLAARDAAAVVPARTGEGR